MHHSHVHFPSDNPGSGKALSLIQRKIMAAAGSKKNERATNPGEESARKRKRKPHSWVWKHCSKLVDGDAHYLVCGFCESKLKTTSTWSTSAMMHHLNKRHGVSKAGVQQTTLNSGSRRWGTSKATQKGLDIRMVQCIVKDSFPVSLTENVGFKNLVKCLAPDCKVPSRCSITKAMCQLEEIGYKIVAEELKAVRTCHVTTDAWSDVRARGFGSLTVSHTTDKWEIRTVPAKVGRMKGRHTAENLARWLASELDSCNLKPVTMTTDNASAQKKACRILVSEKKVLAALGCTPHVVNLVVRKVIESNDVKASDLLDHNSENDDDECDAASVASDEMDELTEVAAEIQEDDECEEEGEAELNDAECLNSEQFPVRMMLKRLRKMNTLIRKSNNLSDMLEDLQAADKAWGRKSRVKMDVATRWSSTHAMCLRAIELKGFIQHLRIKAQNDLKLSKKQLRCFLKDEEWELCAELTLILAPFSVVTQKLSGEKCTTASAVLTLWKRITKTLKKRKESNEHSNSDAVVTTLLDAMSKLWNEHLESPVWKVAAAVDPFFKSLSAIPKADRKKMWDALLEEMTAVKLRMQGEEDDEQLKIDEKNSEGDGNDKEGADPMVDLEELNSSEESEGDVAVSDEELNAALEKAKGGEIDDHTDLLLEIQACKALKLSSDKEKFSALAFWRANESRFPHMAEVARVHLGVNASSVSSERVFSTCGYVVSKTRNRTSAKLLSAIIFLNQCSKRKDLWDKILSSHAEAGANKGKKKT